MQSASEVEKTQSELENVNSSAAHYINKLKWDLCMQLIPPDSKVLRGKGTVPGCFDFYGSKDALEFSTLICLYSHQLHSVALKNLWLLNRFSVLRRKNICFWVSDIVKETYSNH